MIEVILRKNLKFAIYDALNTRASLVLFSVIGIVVNRLRLSLYLASGHDFTKNNL